MELFYRDKPWQWFIVLIVTWILVTNVKFKLHRGNPFYNTHPQDIEKRLKYRCSSATVMSRKLHCRICSCCSDIDFNLSIKSSQLVTFFTCKISCIIERFEWASFMCRVSPSPDVLILGRECIFVLVWKSIPPLWHRSMISWLALVM